MTDQTFDGRAFINGERVAARDGQTFDNISPVDGRVLTAVARCGEADCYVLGTRQSLAQLWVEKRSFEVRRLVLPGRGPMDLEEWRAFERIRFPARVELASDVSTATIAVESVAVAPPLGAADFSAAWVRAAPAVP